MGLTRNFVRWTLLLITKTQQKQINEKATKKQNNTTKTKRHSRVKLASHPPAGGLVPQQALVGLNEEQRHFTRELQERRQRVGSDVAQRSEECSLRKGRSWQEAAPSTRETQGTITVASVQ